MPNGTPMPSASLIFDLRGPGKRLLRGREDEGLNRASADRKPLPISRDMRPQCRLLNRLLTQMERILEVNGLREVSKAVVEAARESLVIGQA